MARGLADIAAEGILLLGAGRAILLQIAHPAIGHGIAEHSDFSHRPLDRLHATMTYVYAVVYGTPEQLAEVRRRVNRAHGPVQSEAAAGTPAYSAFDPELQLWVVATLYDSAAAVYEKIYGALDQESAEQIYRDYAHIGTALQVPAELWPADRAAFTVYWQKNLRRLKTDAVTRRVAQDLLHPAVGPLWLRAAMPLARLLTAGLLPAPVREAFELPWSRGRERRFERVLHLCATVYPRLPRFLRHGPRNYYLAKLHA